MISKIFFKALCLSIFVISMQGLAQLRGRSDYVRQMQGKTPAQAWDVANQARSNSDNYNQAKRAYYTVFGRQYPSTRPGTSAQPPAGGVTPPPATGPKTGGPAIGGKQLTQADNNSWMASAALAISRAKDIKGAVYSLNNLIDKIGQAGYTENADYYNLVKEIMALRDNLQKTGAVTGGATGGAGMQLPPPLKLEIEKPASITGDVQKAMNDAIKALGNAVKAAPDMQTVDYMIQQFNKAMNYNKTQKGEESGENPAELPPPLILED